MSQSQAAVSGSSRGEPSTVVNPERPLTVDQRSSDSMNGRHGSIESDTLARRGLNPAHKAGTEEKPSISTSVPKTNRPLQAGSSVDGDALSVGLTSLMGRVRSKEHRSRSRAAERKEPQEESKERIGESETPSEEPQPSTLAISPPPRLTLLPLLLAFYLLSQILLPLLLDSFQSPSLTLWLHLLVSYQLLTKPFHSTYAQT